VTYNPAQARNNHGEFGTTDVALKGPAGRQAKKVAAGYEPLAGLPQKPIQIGDQWYQPGPIGRLKDAAAEYMKGRASSIIRRPSTRRSTRIARPRSRRPSTTRSTTRTTRR
jgi:hypothetical protein